ncbi:MAG TPA: alpha-glucan family phosphorylase [Vicinamibacterales bacterium]|nr:alpha-glucan family phosphorylase [Vicinamibacterales bacterium]
MAQVAYFSMEIGLETRIPTYAGGLGVLAGDTLRSAADLGRSMVGVTLLHRKGYFRQRLDARGRQSEEPVAWAVEDILRPAPARIGVELNGRLVQVGAWLYELRGAGGAVPVYLLDTDVAGNSDDDRRLTDALYGGDASYRLSQEVVLGVGGVRMLRALGYTQIDRFHMNEGHSSLLVVALLEEQAHQAGRTEITAEDVAAVRARCVFTTHTPVPAGHDRFDLNAARRMLDARSMRVLEDHGCLGGVLNMTYLALNSSHYVNGVAMTHGEVSRQMFGGYTVDAITNGVHAATWAAEEFQALFDRHIPGWRRDNFSLRYALSIPREEVWNAHEGAKRRLIELVMRETTLSLDPAVFTIGFARRAAAYKRADLLIHDVERLKAIDATVGPLQVVYAGKAHPRDEAGKAVIERIFEARHSLGSRVPLAYLEDYDMDRARLLASGVDLWLNTPQPPLEASGTSGMKAALNGVPSLSVLDGWWMEGHVEGVTGWAIDAPGTLPPSAAARSELDAASLYDKLEHTILPLFYHRRDSFVDVMRQAIALNGSFFNSHRMVEEYVLKAYA